MSDTYSEVCGTCGGDREIEIDWHPAEKPSAYDPGCDESWSWGETICWCDCEETDAALNAMVNRAYDETMRTRDTIYYGDRYARGYDDL